MKALAAISSAADAARSSITSYEGCSQKALAPLATLFQPLTRRIQTSSRAKRNDLRSKRFARWRRSRDEKQCSQSTAATLLPCGTMRRPFMPDNSTEKLVRAVGFWGLVAMCINAVVGSGVFPLPTESYKLLGPFSLWVPPIFALPVFILGLCFAEAVSHFS